MKRRAAHLGFTIVELLIVIVVIGILAAITVTAYSGVQNRARAVAVADGLKKTEKAFRLYAIEQGRTTWWDDDTITSSPGHPPVSLVISETGLKSYLQSAPNVSGIPASSWIYDNDLDTYGGCSTSSAGTNIYIPNLNDQALAQSVDTSLDDGNLSCGKVRYDSGGRLLYNISPSSTIE